MSQKRNENSEDIERFEDEGGAWLVECTKCGHLVHNLYEDGLCIFCWLKKKAQQGVKDE